MSQSQQSWWEESGGVTDFNKQYLDSLYLKAEEREEEKRVKKEPQVRSP